MGTQARRKKNIWRMLANFIVLYMVALAIGLLVVIVFRLWAGEHPECNINNSVGPCGFWSWIMSFIPALMIYALIYGIPFVVLADIYIFKFYKRRRE